LLTFKKKTLLFNELQGKRPTYLLTSEKSIMQPILTQGSEHLLQRTKNTQGYRQVTKHYPVRKQKQK